MRRPLTMMIAGLLIGCGQSGNPPQAAVEAASHVRDEADVLTVPEQAAIEARINAILQRSGRQIGVLTVSSLSGEAIEAYSLRRANQWGLGRKGINDGVMILVAPNERQARIEVGIGLEQLLTDARAKAIIDQRMLPRFRSGDVSGAVAAGIEGITAIIAPAAANDLMVSGVAA